MLSKEIRELLKKEGFKRTDISVRNVRCTMDTIVDVTIKNPYINRKQVDDLLKHFRDIDRDERTGEILSGGNTFVSVEWEYGIFNEVRQAYVDTAEKAMSAEEKFFEILPGLSLSKFDRLEVRQKNKVGYKVISTANELAEYIFKYLTFGNIFA